MRRERPLGRAEGQTRPPGGFAQRVAFGVAPVWNQTPANKLKSQSPILPGASDGRRIWRAGNGFRSVATGKDTAMRYSSAHSLTAKELALSAARRLALLALTTPPEDFEKLCPAEIEDFENQRDLAAEEMRLGHGKLRSLFEEDALVAFEAETNRIRSSIMYPTSVQQ